MDPVTIGAVLAAVAGGAGGALGSQVWNGVCALVRRPFRHDRAAGDDAATTVSSGEAALTALAQAPSDAAAAELAQVLVTRAAVDREFAQDLAAWWEQASQVQVNGDVSNTISGGTQYGPVLQGRDFSGLNFGAPAAPTPPPVRDPGA